MSDATRFVVGRIDWVESEYWRYVHVGESCGRFASRRSGRSMPPNSTGRRREAEARSDANPFLYGGEALFYQTSLDAARLHDWLMDAGIEPPAEPNGHSAWVAWWNACAHAWSAEQLAHAWAAFDKVRFFEVTEEHLMRKAYVVVEVNWTWQDEQTLYADYEGGRVWCACVPLEEGGRSRVRASQPSAAASERTPGLPVLHEADTRRWYRCIGRDGRNRVL